MFKLHFAQKAGFYSKSVWFLLLMIQTEDKFDSHLCRGNREGEAMKKNYGSICCCKNFEWAESQSRPDLPIARVNVAAMQECGELLWRGETICRITWNMGVLHWWMISVRCISNIFSWNQRNPFLDGVNPTLWQWLHGGCIAECCSLTCKGWQQHSPIPATAPACALQLHTRARPSCRGQRAHTASLQWNWGRNYQQIFLISYDYPSVVWSEKNRLYNCKLGCICIITETQKSSSKSQGFPFS